MRLFMFPPHDPIHEFLRPCERSRCLVPDAPISLTSLSRIGAIRWYQPRSSLGGETEKIGSARSSIRMSTTTRVTFSHGNSKATNSKRTRRHLTKNTRSKNEWIYLYLSHNRQNRYFSNRSGQCGPCCVWHFEQMSSSDVRFSGPVTFTWICRHRGPITHSPLENYLGRILRINWRDPVPGQGCTKMAVPRRGARKDEVWLSAFSSGNHMSASPLESRSFWTPRRDRTSPAARPPYAGDAAVMSARTSSCAARRTRSISP